MEPNVLVAVVYNGGCDSRLWVLDESIRNTSVHGVDHVVCDDTSDKIKTAFNQEHFKKIDYMYYDTTGLRTKEEKIVVCRNELRDYFLKRKRYTHILWLESDILITKDVVDRLLSCNVDNVTAVRTQHGGIPGVFPYNDTQPRELWKTRHTPNFRLTSYDELASLNTKLLQVSCYGSGCNLVSRKATEAASFWVKPYSPCTHDIAYCMDLDALGFPCYADTSTICPHYYSPMKLPDERFSYGGDWSNIDEFRRKSVQAKVLNW
jgi:hypothetical protein